LRHHHGREVQRGEIKKREKRGTEAGFRLMKNWASTLNFAFMHETDLLGKGKSKKKRNENISVGNQYGGGKIEIYEAS